MANQRSGEVSHVWRITIGEYGLLK